MLLTVSGEGSSFASRGARSNQSHVKGTAYRAGPLRPELLHVQFANVFGSPCRSKVAHLNDSPKLSLWASACKWRGKRHEMAPPSLGAISQLLGPISAVSKAFISHWSMLFWEPSKCHGGHIFAWQHCRISTNDEFDLASAKSGSTPANEQQKMWETYYGAFNKMEPHGNLQLHPNHPAVYSVSDSRVNRLVIYFVPVLSYLLKSRGCSIPNTK